MKKMILLFLALGALALLGGCGDANKPANTPAAKSVTIGVMPDVDSIPFIIAQEKGYFKEEGVTVTLKFFKSAVERDSALQSGNLDGVISDMLAENFAKKGGFDTVITSLTTGSYKLIVGKGETAATLQDLKGKDVAISKNTIIEYVTDKVAAEGKLPADSFNKIAIPQIPTRLEMLQNGKIAAATLPEPLASVAVKNGGRVLQSSDQMGINPGVMLFTRQAVNDKEQEIRAVYRAYAKAVAYLEKEPMSAYIDLLIEKGGFPKEVKGALILPQYKKPSAPQAKDIEAVGSWLKERQLVTTTYSYQELVDDRFVR